LQEPDCERLCSQAFGHRTEVQDNSDREKGFLSVPFYSFHGCIACSKCSKFESSQSRRHQQGALTTLTLIHHSSLQERTAHMKNMQTTTYCTSYHRECNTDLLRAGTSLLLATFVSGTCSNARKGDQLLRRFSLNRITCNASYGTYYFEESFSLQPKAESHEQ
jgi:hypothetical protein